MTTPSAQLVANSFYTIVFLLGAALIWRGLDHLVLGLGENVVQGLGGLAAGFAVWVALAAHGRAGAVPKSAGGRS